MDSQANILPVYFVADESGSMASVIDKLNTGLVSLHDAMLKESQAAAKVRMTILAFNDTTRCLMDLVDLRTLEMMPTLSPSGTTAYSAAFKDLRSRIESDVDRLKQQEFQVHRPAVFFLTDGVPNDNDPWKAALDELRSSSWTRRPNVLAFGVGSADARVVTEIASKPEFAFISPDGTDTGDAIAKFMESLTQSIVSSGQALASGNAQLQVEPPKGFSLAVDLLP